jgi:hypothetical protein
MNYKILIILLLPLFSFRCIKKSTLAKFIEVDNQLPQNVYCVPNYEYPDTTLSFTNKPVIVANEASFFIKAASKDQLFYRALCDSIVWNKIMTTDTLQLVVIDEKVFKEHSWEEIVSRNLYVRRLLFSYDDIIKNGCKITIR